MLPSQRLFEYQTAKTRRYRLANPKQGNHKPLTLPPVCNILHHKVSGLRLAASATAHGLAAWLHHQAGWLFQCHTSTPAYGPLCANTSSINRKYITYRNGAKGRPSHGEDRTCSFGDMLADRQTDTILCLPLPAAKLQERNLS